MATANGSTKASKRGQMDVENLTHGAQEPISNDTPVDRVDEVERAVESQAERERAERQALEDAARAQEARRQRLKDLAASMIQGNSAGHELLRRRIQGQGKVSCTVPQGNIGYGLKRAPAYLGVIRHDGLLADQAQITPKAVRVYAVDQEGKKMFIDE